MSQVTRVRSDWRPTRQRFGMLSWRGQDALLTLDLVDDGPFLDKFVVAKAASRAREEAISPGKTPHLALFAAWEFACPRQAYPDLFNAGELG